ncbi:L-lactate dehydrogenase (cytochrome) [Trichomonascus vanleenenianus]|uniref:FMN-dependent alpha-hydroxy acid dehydrogenase n=1 Tax=Trichomonascus vanleenenianus TaxID=2268995 RepID=UPI003ECA225D
MSNKLTLAEVSKHNSSESCWVIINRQVYDVTDFLTSHPGGRKAILRLAGQDATEDFEMIHPKGTIEENLDESVHVGELDESEVIETTSSESPEQPKGTLPALPAMLNLYDFEATAKSLLAPKAWAYYFSASDDLLTKDYNQEAFRKVLLRPRVFKNAVSVNTESSIAGYKTKLPVFVAPAAMARLAHESGERGIAAACGREGILQMISNNASMKFEDIVVEPVDENQKFFFQLYVQNQRSKSEQQLAKAFATGRCLGVVLTLDAVTPGKREADERMKNEGATFSENSGHGEKDASFQSEGLGKALFNGTASDLVWDETLPWLRKHIPQGAPIILKGLQTFEDAVLAAEHGTTGILLSNHGGRAMDQCQPPLLILQELRENCPEVFDKLEVYIDGGIRRGTDVVKALCLGAKQVGIGRAALYALAGYGAQGVERTIQILREEIETAMRLLGVYSIDELGPQHVNTRQLDALVYKPKL